MNVYLSCIVKYKNNFILHSNLSGTQNTQNCIYEMNKNILENKIRKNLPSHTLVTSHCIKLKFKKDEKCRIILHSNLF